MRGKILKKLNERILKWPTEKRAFTKIKPRMCEKYIPTQENVEEVFLRKYCITENGIHCVNCTFSYTQEKMGAVEKHVQNNESTTRKKRKEGCKFVEFL